MRLEHMFSIGGRLLIPFCLWSIFYTIISAAQTIYAGENIRWGRIVYRFIVGKAATPFYYIVVLAQFTLLTPILVKEIRKKGMISKLLWLVTPLYIVGLYFLTIKRGSLPRLYETFFPAWFVFYYMGLWIKINGPFKISERFGKTPLVICTIGLSLIEVIVMNLVGIDASFACSQLKCSSLLFAIVLILWLLKKESTMMQTNNSASRILKAFGDCSYGIFYIHCLILIVVEKILILVGLDEIWILYFIVTWLLTSAISLEIVRVVNMAGHRSSFGSKVLSWIGFV